MKKQLTIGIRQLSNEVEWSSVSCKKGVTSVLAHESKTLELSGDSEKDASALVSMLKSICVGRPKVSVAIPLDRVLLRVVELPSTEMDELRGMVDLQVDKFSPFPVEQMSVSFESLSQTANSTRVLIAAVRREEIDNAGGFCCRTVNSSRKRDKRYCS